MPDRMRPSGVRGRPRRAFPVVFTTIGMEEPIRLALTATSVENGRSLSFESNFRLARSLEQYEKITLHPTGSPRDPVPQIRTTIGLDKPVREKLEKTARESGRSMGFEANLRLRKSIEEEVL